MIKAYVWEFAPLRLILLSGREPLAYPKDEDLRGPTFALPGFYSDERPSFTPRNLFSRPSALRGQAYSDKPQLELSWLATVLNSALRSLLVLSAVEVRGSPGRRHGAVIVPKPQVIVGSLRPLAGELGAWGYVALQRCSP